VAASLDALLVALYVVVDDLLPKRTGRGAPPRISDAEMICLAIAQVLLDVPKERRFLRLVGSRLSHLFPYVPKQPGYNKRLRALTPKIVHCMRYLAFVSPSFCDNLRLLDSTPVPCGQSRETVKRSDMAGTATYGYCASHSRWFWGVRLYVLFAPDGMPIDFELAPANAPEREVAAGMLERAARPGDTVLADKGFAGDEFEGHVRSLGATLLRPDRANEPYRLGNLGGVRQWVEALIDQLKDQLSLERHGARKLDGLCARISQRLLAIAACVWHNHLIGQPGHSLVAYDH
jgi:hypothetical protein